LVEIPISFYFQIEAFKSDSRFLTSKQISFLEQKISRTKNPNLELDQCLNCIVCQNVPKEDNVGVGVVKEDFKMFSCSQHHLICQDCVDQVMTCFVCEEDFYDFTPSRNYLAERMIEQIWSKTPQIDASIEAPANNTEMNQGNLKINKIMLLKKFVFVCFSFYVTYFGKDK
jgi:hypothetical protein